MILGITGTRKGMTLKQRVAVVTFLTENVIDVAHHGDCLGVDAEVHALIRTMQPNCRIVCHPGPDGDYHRAHCVCDEYRAPLTHFARNREIVKACEFLIGVSLTPEAADRGGTWYTINYARKLGRSRAIFWPDGLVEYGGVDGPLEEVVQRANERGGR